MNKSLILGLAWLDKCGPTIWWEGGFWKLRIVNGPSLPLLEQGVVRMGAGPFGKKKPLQKQWALLTW